MQDPLSKAIAMHRDLSEDAQRAAGKAAAGVMDAKHQAFLDLLLGLLQKKVIDPKDPRSFLNDAVYEKLSEAEKDGIDLALMNLGHLLEDVVEFRLSKATPDASPQLQTMIEQLWQMKDGIEQKAGDVFKF